MSRVPRALVVLAMFSCSNMATDLGPKRWEKDIAAFEAQDLASPPPRNGIVFTGSSSIALWSDLEQAFPEFPIINRGFGGSTTADVTFFVDRIVSPYKPQIVVLSSGTNDIAGHRTPRQVLVDFRSFVKKVHATLPEANVFYLSIHTPPGRIELRDMNQQANTLIAQECARDPALTFVDIQDLMITKDGQPNQDLYRDALHPNAKGYELWKTRLTPLFREKYKQAKSAGQSVGPRMGLFITLLLANAKPESELP
jgi:lysophospholipase L1-like esterase